MPLSKALRKSNRETKALNDLHQLKLSENKPTKEEKHNVKNRKKYQKNIPHVYNE